MTTQLKWRADRQAFEIVGHSVYRAEFHGLGDDHESVQGRLYNFLSQYWEREQWERFKREMMLRTWVRLVALGRPQQDNLRIGFAGYSPGIRSDDTGAVGFITLDPVAPEDRRGAKHGVRRLSEFIQKTTYPVVCEAEIWLRENRDTGTMKLDCITLVLPYEDEVAAAVLACERLAPADKIRPSLSEAELHAAIYNNGVELGGNLVRWNDEKSQVTIHPPSRSAFNVSCLHERDKIQRHVDENVPRHIEELELALIPRPDNDYDQEAISIALPQSYDGTPDERHVAYLRKQYKDPRLGKLLANLARYSGGEIRCFGDIERGMYASAPIDPLLPTASMLEDDIQDFLQHPETPPLEDQPTIRKLLGFKRHKGLPHEAENKRQQALKAMTRFSS